MKRVLGESGITHTEASLLECDARGMILVQLEGVGWAVCWLPPSEEQN